VQRIDRAKTFTADEDGTAAMNINGPLQLLYFIINSLRYAPQSRERQEILRQTACDPSWTS